MSPPKAPKIRHKTMLLILHGDEDIMARFYAMKAHAYISASRAGDTLRLVRRDERGPFNMMIAI